MAQSSHLYNSFYNVYSLKKNTFVTPMLNETNSLRSLCAESLQVLLSNYTCFIDVCVLKMMLNVSV